MQALVDDLLATGRIQSADEYQAKVDSKIQEVMKLIFNVVKDKLDLRYGCFELFGFDFLIDDNLNPSLIEINVNPALYTDTEVQKHLLPKLVDDIVKLSLAVHPFGHLDAYEEVKHLMEGGGLQECQLKYDIIHYDGK